MESYNILVVDDDREIVRSLAKLLEVEGYQVYKAYHGLEALDILMERQIHLILLDVMMPKLNGADEDSGKEQYSGDHALGKDGRER